MLLRLELYNLPFSFPFPTPFSRPLFALSLTVAFDVKKVMGSLHFLVFYSFVLTLISQNIHIAAYTLAPSESIVDGQTLISQGSKFELGFFSPSNSNKRYLGIWYKTIPIQTVVWVANRDSPLYDTSGVVKIGTTGNIVVVNKTESIIWSSNSSKVVENPILEFLESSNLVLRDRDSTSYLWQSFDYPGNTLLPGMTLGLYLKTGMTRYLTSWNNFDDPSNGGFTFGIDRKAYLEKILYEGSKKYYRTGPWNGLRFSGAPALNNNTIFTYQVVHNAEEIYYTYQLVDQSVILRGVLTQTTTDAQYQLLTWVNNSNSWVLLVAVRTDRCDDYELCGPYRTCNSSDVLLCKCLEGFSPKSPLDWMGTDWSLGCKRDASVNCTKGEGFVKYTGVKLPDTTGTWVDTSMNLEECRVKCLNNCSCMAYANSDIRGGGSGCIIWSSDLIDIRQLSSDGQDIYIRMAASALDSKANSRTKERVIMIASIPFVAGIILLGFGSWFVWKKRFSKGGCECDDDLELPLYDLVTMTTATNNFSEENKLGQGGFGQVYKGKLEGEQEIAVKRLSKHSTQGAEEFKNEVILISKLQHKNLVRLLGCCIQGKEKMLVYEYMRNKSLDLSIFDKTNSRLLDWKKRFHIILGIARGLVYLHHDSRLMIIHRDLKASNILLDSEMVPKIADFGLARIFDGDQIEANTTRVAGTHGYMSPEYAVDGHFSVKSDVFSFGVIVLEIISGYKNWSFRHPDHDHNLLGHARRLWNEERSIELVDASMSYSCFTEDVLRCIHIGLLCVQKDTKQRPTMSSVVLMLGSETVVLPHPQVPGFYIERTTPTPGDSFCSSNDATITLVEAR